MIDHHWTQSWATSIFLIPSQPVFLWSVIILSSNFHWRVLQVAGLQKIFPPRFYFQCLCPIQENSPTDHNFIDFVNVIKLSALYKSLMSLLYKIIKCRLNSIFFYIYFITLPSGCRTIPNYWLNNNLFVLESSQDDNSFWSE
jgi:hypothetical protein